MAGDDGRLLLAEDDASLARMVVTALTRSGYAVTHARTGTAALAAARASDVDLLILDVGLPGLDGLEVCRALRAEDRWLPIIFLTARDDEVTRVAGLDVGADDYLTKPFSMRELRARVGALLRRSRLAPSLDTTSGETDPDPEDGQRVVVLGDLTCDQDAHLVTVGGAPVDLTHLEFELLWHLISAPRRVHTRDQLLRAVWGQESSSGTRTVDVHIAQLRRKLGAASPIRTVQGIGYGITPSPDGGRP